MAYITDRIGADIASIIIWGSILGGLAWWVWNDLKRHAAYRMRHFMETGEDVGSTHDAYDRVMSELSDRKAKRRRKQLQPPWDGA